MTRILLIAPLLLATACTGNFSTSRCVQAPDGKENCAVIHQFTGSDLFDPTIVSATAYHDGKPVGASLQVIAPPATSITSAAIGGGVTALGFGLGASSIDVPKNVSTTVKLTQ